MQRLCCRPYAVHLRRGHSLRPQIRWNALAALAVTPPVFKLLSCFFDFGRNRYRRSLTHQHALLVKNGTLKPSGPATRIHARLPEGHRELRRLTVLNSFFKSREIQIRAMNQELYTRTVGGRDKGPD